MSGVLNAANSLLTGLERSIFQLAMEISPILFVGGIAGRNGIAGSEGALPIVALTEGANFTAGLLSGQVPSLDNFLCHFRPLSGSTIQDYQYARYPMANQRVAANATIFQPLHVSLVMTAPIRAVNSSAILNTLVSRGFSAADIGGGRLAVFTGLKEALDRHALLGGTYTVITPTYIYRNCLLLSVRDVSGGETKQLQTTWQWDFEQPLITMADAEQSQNVLTSAMTTGTMTDGSLSGGTTGAATVNPNTGGYTFDMPGTVPGAPSAAPAVPPSPVPATPPVSTPPAAPAPPDNVWTIPPPPGGVST